MVFRTFSGLMAALFAMAVAVQYNDPDPLRWIAIYGGALTVSILVAARGRVPLLLPAAVGSIALVWGLLVASGNGATAGVYQHMFDAWEMKNTTIEEAREASGLLIVSVWMLIVCIKTWSSASRANA